MRRIAVIAMLSTLALLAGCAGQVKPENARPDWVDGPSAQYPAKGWLLGRGTADSQSKAADRARADLAKTFSVRVDAVSRDVSRYESGAAGTQNTQQTERSVETRTDQVLQGANIADYWTNPKTGEVYALAVLSRSRAGQILRSQIADLDAHIHGLVQQAGAAREPLRQASFLGRAMAVAGKRADLNRELEAVALTGQGMPTPYSLDRLATRRADVLSSVRLSTAAGGPDGDAIQPLLASALAVTGLHDTPGAERQLLTQLTVTALPKRNGWYWERGVVQMTLTDAQGGVIASDRWPVKASATDAATAHQRLLSQVGELLNKQMLPFLERATGQH